MSNQSLYEYYDPTYVPEPFGLQNTGTICWFNSLLQMLLGLPSLNRAVLECEAELHNNPFAVEYIKLLKQVVEGYPIKHALDSASCRILQAMLKRMRAMKPGVHLGTGQECVDEGLIIFIDLLGCNRVEKLFSNTYELSITCTGCHETISSVRDRALRIQMFTPLRFNTEQLFQDYICVHNSDVDAYTCGKCGKVMRTIYREPAAAARNQPTVTTIGAPISSTLTREEPVEVLQRLEQLKMLREIVIIVFDEFKEKTNRWFPLQLQFPCSRGGYLTYKLVGKINHIGTAAGGHYWANSLRGGKWYKINDNAVSTGWPTPEYGVFMIAYHMVDESHPRPIEVITSPI